MAAAAAQAAQEAADAWAQSKVLREPHLDERRRRIAAGYRNLAARAQSASPGEPSRLLREAEGLAQDGFGIGASAHAAERRALEAFRKWAAQAKAAAAEEARRREERAAAAAAAEELHYLRTRVAALEAEAQRRREQQAPWDREVQHRAAVEARYREEQREAEQRAGLEGLRREAWAATAPRPRAAAVAGVAANDAQARRVTDVDLEAVLDFSPIVGVAKAPCFPVLDAAMATGVEDMDVFGYIASEAGARLAKDDPHGLDKEEAGAIYLYSMESDLYKSMNQLLRLRNRDGLKPYFPMLRLLLAAKHKLPPMHGTVWRGVKVNLAGKYTPGLEFYWWAFSSTTRELAVLEKPEFLGNTGARTIFNIQMMTGREISRYSFFSGAEAEVLLFPGTRFRVLSCANLGADLHMVHLEELDVPVPLLR